jgi:hypothetical protein
MFDIRLKEKQQEQYEIMARAMDSREKVFKLMNDYEKLHGFIPSKLISGYRRDGVLIGGHKFMAEYENFKRFGSWRDQDGVVEKIVKASMKAAENKN